MASAFATGFLAGQRGYQQVLDNDRQKVLDERAAKEFARKEQEWSRADSERAAVDRALGDYADLEKSGTAVGLNTSGFSDGSARMLYGQGGQQGVDEAATYANLENARFGLPRVNQTSQAADPVAAPAPTVGLRPAMRSDRLKALQGVALAKKDVSAAAALGEQLNTAQDDEFVAQALKSYTGAEEQIGSAATYLNNNSKRLTMGAPDKNGFVPLSVVRPDGRAEFLNLTKQDQARLYAAAQLMERNPTRAIEMMSGVNKELATAVAQENGLTSTLTTNANDVASKSGTLRVAQQNADTNEAYRRDTVGLQRERLKAAGAAADAADGFQRKIDGVLEGYQAAVAAGSKEAAAIYAREYDQLRATTPKGLRVPPSLAALNNAQKPQGVSKPVKVEDAGQAFLVDGALKYSDGRGGFIAEKGVLPQNRTAALVSGGVPDALVSRLPWNVDGTHVLFGNSAYDVRDPADMRSLREDYRRLAGNTIAVEEANRVDYHTSNDTPRGFGPRLTAVPAPNAPSIYASPEAWQEYRNQQGR